MRNIFVATLAAGLVLTVGNAAMAQSPEPSAAAKVNVGGQSFDLSSAITDNGTLFSLPSTSLALAGGSVVTVGFEGDRDPSMSYSFAVTNSTPFAQTYDFDLTIPIIPTVSNSPTNASLIGSLTDGGSDGIVTVTQTGEFTALQRATGVDTAGVDYSLGLDVGPDVTVSGDPGDSFTYSPVVKSGVSSFIITALDVHLHFTLSGNGDAASFNGRVSVTGAPATQGLVPEPGSVALLGAIGVCASGWTLRRRRSRG